MKVTEEGGQGGVEFGKIVNAACCSILDTLQQFSCRGWESSQERVAVVNVADDERLAKEMHLIFCEERPDPVDIVEGKSAGLGHSSDVGGTGQSVVEDYARGPRCQRSQYRDILNTDRSMRGQPFHGKKKEFSFTEVEFEIMCSCPSADVCQTLRDVCRNVGVGGGWGKRKKQLGAASITVVGESMRCDCRA